MQGYEYLRQAVLDISLSSSFLLKGQGLEGYVELSRLMIEDQLANMESTFRNAYAQVEQFFTDIKEIVNLLDSLSGAFKKDSDLDIELQSVITP